MVRWALLVLALTAAQVVILSTRFFYGNDDLLQFSVARDEGLSWTTLSLNVFQHFGPYDRAGHLLVVRLTDLSPQAGLFLVASNVAAMLAACLWFMAELQVPARRRVAALVVVGLSVSVSESAIWFDAGMHVLPAIAATLAICAAHVRAVRTGRWRWHAVTTVLFVVGQLIQERPLFALPLCVLADMLLLWRLLPWSERRHRLWSLRRPLLLLSVVAAVIVAALRAFVVEDELPSADVLTTLRTMLVALTNYVVPAMVNLPREDPTASATQLAVLGGVVLVGILVSRLRPGNAGPVLFAACTFLMYYGFLKFSPLLNEDTVTANAERLTNAAYVTVPAVLALVQLRLPGPAAWRIGRGWPAAAAIMAIYLTLSNVAYLDRQWSDTTRARAYLDTVRAGVATWSDPGVTVVPLFANPAMATGWSVPYSRHDGLLRLIRQGFTPGDLGPDPVFLDDAGVVRQAALVTVSSQVAVTNGGCGSSTTSDDPRLSVTPDVRGGPLFVALTYESDQDTIVQLASGWDGQWDLNAFPTHVQAGRHTQLVPVDASELEAVALSSLPDTAGSVCVSGASIVRPVMVVPDAGCRAIDRYGRPGRPVPCP